jgi:uncharacterized protein YbcI
MPDANARTAEAHLNRALANAVVQCYHRLAGRGPTKAQAFCRANLVVVVLGAVLTLVERNLVADGRQDAVREHRAAMHETMVSELAGAIEKLTGRRVQATLSADDVDHDIAAEVFVLERLVPPSTP